MELKEKTKRMGLLHDGFLHLLLNLILLVGTVYLFTQNEIWLGCVLGVETLLWLKGFKVIPPNHARVLIFLGKYKGTVRRNGFVWVNPLYSSFTISLRADNMDVEPIKVNDRNGNPIMIGLVLVWRVEDTYRACFDVETHSYKSFVAVQSDAALRKVASLYAYDNMDASNPDELTLRQGGDIINQRLEEEIRQHLSIAGIEVVEARINYLAYAQEIASVMLKRQQAEAIIAAREKIVEGAVSVVEMAVNKMAADGIVHLDEDRKAAMVSNLMVVLCSDEGAAPVINAGSSH